MKPINFFSVIVLIAAIAIGCSDGVKKGNTPHKNKNTHTIIDSVSIPGAVGMLSAVIQSPDRKPSEKYPLVILMHGIASNKEVPLITLLADKLQAEGIASIRFDFDGHGQSEGSFQDMTVPKEIGDAQAIFDYVKNLNWVSGISLAGHSQGGVVASMLGGKLGDSIQSIVLMAPAAVLEYQAKNGNTLGSKFDPNNLPEYIEVFGQKIGREYLHTAQNLNIYQTAAAYQGPVCIIQGLADQVVPSSYAQKYDEIYTNSQIYLLKGEDHSFEQDKNKATNIASEFFKNELLKP